MIDFLQYKMLGDFRFWLLFFAINMSGNICFGYFFPDKITIICLAFYVILFFILKKEIDLILLYFTSCFIVIFALQAFLLTDYSLQSSLHFLLKIFTGIGVASIVGDKFVYYYKKIICFFCIVSLFCFTLNCIGVVIPYIIMPSSGIDGGQVLRVSSVIYTQLYDVEHNLGLTLRNCGPFWEPGAFQGFINLALFFDFYNHRSSGSFFSKESVVYIITILTTLSTGGYVTMFFIISCFIIQNRKISLTTKLLFISISLIIFAYLFINIEFLGDKITRDANSKGGRLSLDFSNVDFIKILIGSGLDPKSFLNNSLVATGSLIMLIIFTGVSGFLILFLFLYRNISIDNMIFIIIISMILINEPFLTSGPFWWCLPKLVNFINSDKYQIDLINKKYIA